MPASAEALDASITPLGHDGLAAGAASVSHPLLHPVTIGADGSLTPRSAAVVAVLQNPTLRAARSRRGVSQAQLLQAGILPNPQLSGSMDFPIAGATDGTVNAFGIGATWDFTSLIGRDQVRAAAAGEVEKTDLEVAWQEWQAAMGAQLHAARVLWLEQQRQELTSQVEYARKAEENAIQNSREGLSTVIDAAAASAFVQKRRASLLSVEAALASERTQLAETLGVPPGTPIHLQNDEESGPSDLPSPSEVADAIEHNRLDLAALRAGYASQESKLHAAVLSQFPKIGLGVTRARDTTDVGTIGFGVTLDLPIFDRGQGRIAIEHATRQMLFDELAARTFEARAEAARALAELQAVGPQLQDARQTAKHLEALAAALEQARNHGDADIVQLNQARNDAADASNEVLRLGQQQAELRIALEVATGRIWEGATP
jgi:outer membrane protein TolC